MTAKLPPETTEAIKDHIAKNVTVLPSSRPTFSASWFEECEHEAEEWLVRGLIPVRSYVLLYGRRGAAKSFMGLDIANNGATGRAILGQEVTEKFGTIYFVGEKKSRFGKRVKAWRLAHGFQRSPVLFVWGAPNLLDEASVSETVAFINKHKAEFEERGVRLELVVFDTLVRALHGANDSDFEVAGKATGAIQKLIDECAVTVMPLHHMAKGKDADTARGAGVWEDAADSIIRIEREPDSPIRKVSLTKQSDEADGLQFGFKLEVVEVGETPRGHKVTSCVVRTVELDDEPARPKRPPKLSPASQKVMSAFNRLMDEGRTHPVPMVPGAIPGVKSVLLNDLREKAYEIGLTAAAAPSSDNVTDMRKFKDARLKAFNRAMEQIEGANVLRQERGFVWDPKARPGQ